MHPRQTSGRRSLYAYQVHGLRLRSEWRLPYLRRAASSEADVDLLHGSRSRFSEAIQEARVVTDQNVWPRGVRLAGGQTYMKWSGGFEFLISADGRVITARPVPGASRETFHLCLLGPVLSFALIKQGFDPLHATTVTIDGAAVAFLGDSGYGKSSLGASFVQAGHRLLTDDLLMLAERDGGFIAHPGPPRIKLFPAIARRIFGPTVRGTPITTMMPKRVIPLAARQSSSSAAPLKAIYVLSAPARGSRAPTRISIRRLSRRQACVALLRGTFNTAITDPGRLRRQFAMAASVAAALPVRQISYPRRLGILPAVQDAIVADQSRA